MSQNGRLHVLPVCEMACLDHLSRSALMACESGMSRVRELLTKDKDGQDRLLKQRSNLEEDGAQKGVLAILRDLRMEYPDPAQVISCALAFVTAGWAKGGTYEASIPIVRAR